MYDCIVSLKEWQVYCRSFLHRRTFIYEEEYTDCILVFIIRVCDFQKMNSDHFGKQKIWHAISVAIVWDSFGEILSPYNDIMPMPNYSLFREFQIVGPNFSKRKNDKNFKKIDTELIFSIKNQTLLSFT